MDTKELAIEAFSRHEIIRRDDKDGRWRIARRDAAGRMESCYATEIISLWGGGLYVGGDISDCIFAHYHGPEEGEAFNLAKLRWMGKHTDLGYYVKQKASIGLSDSGRLTDEWDNDVARLELGELLADKGNDWCDSDKEVIKEAIMMADRGSSQHEVFDQLYCLRDPVDAFPSSLGLVTAPRVIYAWAACRRLCELLKEAELKVVK